jgi:hypothetical protein
MKSLTRRDGPWSHTYSCLEVSLSSSRSWQASQAACAATVRGRNYRATDQSTAAINPQIGIDRTAAAAIPRAARRADRSSSPGAVPGWIAAPSGRKAAIWPMMYDSALSQLSHPAHGFVTMGAEGL